MAAHLPDRRTADDRYRFTTTWLVLAVLGATGFAAALRWWQRHDQEVLTHLHEAATIDPVRLGDATVDVDVAGGLVTITATKPVHRDAVATAVR